jgi:hypothetical protein
LGVTASRIEAPKVLRFCPACHADQIARSGERLWLRTHQLPGSVVCHVHGELLRRSRVYPRQVRRHHFVRADDKVCPDQPTAKIRASAQDRLLDIAQRQAELCVAPPPARCLEEWMPMYRDRLADGGFMRSRHKVDQQRLVDAMRDHFGTAAAYLPLSCRSMDAGGWQEEMVRTHRRAMHPLLHVMMQSFLDAAVPVVDPFGRGPWPCLNPLADHRGEHRILVMDRYVNRGALIGVFGCGDCGYAYTRGIDASGVLLPPRLQHPGPLLEDALRRLICPGAPLRTTARQVGMDPKTMIRHALALGLDVPWGTRPSGRPPASSSAPSRTHNHRMPNRKPRASGKPRIDWHMLDIATAAKLREAARLIAAEAPPRRVTLAEPERSVVSVGWISKRRSKLPGCTAAAAHLIEIVGDFQRRRARYFIRTMGDGVAAWRVMRAAGLTGRHLSMISEELQKVRTAFRRAA